MDKSKSSDKKLSGEDSVRVPSTMSGEEKEEGKKEKAEGESTDGETLKTVLKAVCCMKQKKPVVESYEKVGKTVADGPMGENDDDDELDEYEDEKKEVEDVDRNNIVEGPELLKEAIFGPDYKNIEKPGILINIWPLESRRNEKVAKILSLEVVDEAKIMGSYYKIKLLGKRKGREEVSLLVNKGSGDEVLKIKERQYKFVTEIRSDEVPELKKLLLKRSENRKIPKPRESAFDLDFPREMVGEDEVDGRVKYLIEKTVEMNNPFKKYYYGYKRYGNVEDSTPSEKMTPESEESSMEKSGSSRGIGILMGEFSEEDSGEREMSEEEIKTMAEET